MWLNRLERKFGRYGIPRLMNLIIAGQALVYLVWLFFPSIPIFNLLSLSREGLMGLQLWRLVTFIFVPGATSPVSLVLMLYLYYFIGSSLESAWGTFRFNVYYLCGMVGAVLSCLVCGYGYSQFFTISLFLAFACLYPDQSLLLFFLLPIKVKYLGLAAGAYMLLLFLTGGWAVKANILFSLLNFILFFGKPMVQMIKTEYQVYQNRKRWRDANRRY